MEWWKSLFRKRALDAQLDSELRFHVEELTAANIAAGLTPEEARRRAVLEFGGREQIKEELRDVHRISIVESTLANLKSAFRFIRKAPSFSIIVIVTLALGIGANSAVFSAIDAILLRSLPFPNGDQLMELRQYNPKMKSPRTRLAPVRLEDWNRMNSTFQAITGYYSEDNSETSGALPEKVTQAFVAPRFLQVWSVSPALGRDFNSEEEHFGGPNAILISDRFWRRRFGADPNALGKKLRINGYSSSIVGVMPASFLFPDRDVDVWSPGPPDAPIAQSREWTWYLAIGRQTWCNARASARKPGDSAKATRQRISKNRCGLERGDRAAQGNDRWRRAEIALDFVRFRFSASSDCLHKHHCVASGPRRATPARNIGALFPRRFPCRHRDSAADGSFCFGARGRCARPACG